MTEHPSNSADRVCRLNDAFRRSLVGGVVAVTAGVEALPRERRAALIAHGARLRRLHRRQRSTRRARFRRSMRTASGTSGSRLV